MRKKIEGDETAVETWEEKVEKTQDGNSEESDASNKPIRRLPSTIHYEHRERNCPEEAHLSPSST